MKKIFFLATILMAVNFNAQEKQDTLITKDGKITFEKVIELNLFDKAKIYNKALEFSAKYLISANDEIQLKDKDQGKIIIKTSELLKYNMGKGILSELIIIECKDGKSRIQVTNFSFIHQNYPTKIIIAEEYPKSWMGRNSFYSSIKSSAEKIISDFGAYMVSEKKDEW